jgi:hypothetical protein
LHLVRFVGKTLAFRFHPLITNPNRSEVPSLFLSSCFGSLRVEAFPRSLTSQVALSLFGGEVARDPDFVNRVYQVIIPPSSSGLLDSKT